jgi:hypothetical protein
MNKLCFLVRIIVDEDIDFLNETSINHKFHTISENDSGWCDFMTGSRILSNNDEFLFYPENKEDETILQLKFGNRLTEV